MKRQRGRNRNNNNNNNNRNNSNRSMESNGPDVKVRGAVSTIYEKYTQLASDAKLAGNRVKAESLRQHGEHYLRLMNEQEALREAERAEREARDAKRAERNENNRNDSHNNRNETEDGDTRRQPRARRPRRDETTSDQDVSKHVEVKSEVPTADAPSAEVADEKPKRRTRKAAPKASDVAAEQPDVAEEKPKRRRRAPARPKDTGTVEAAE
jgi:hypothetical protein